MLGLFSVTNRNPNLDKRDFATNTEHYFPGMSVIVTLNFHSGDPMPREYIGDVVRLERLEDGKWGVAIRILMRYNPGVYSGK